MVYTKNQVAAAILQANRLLDDDSVPTDKVVGILEPLHDCTDVTGVSEENRLATVAMIFALTADAYRKGQNFDTAAFWYHKASEFSPSGHAEIYAHMVCGNRLSEYYQDAYEILIESREHWKRRPWHQKLFLTLYAWRWWLDPEGREMSFSQSKNLKFLENQLR